MANSDLKRTPHHISEDYWWYEDPAGIEISDMLPIRLRLRSSGLHYGRQRRRRLL